MQIEPGLEQLSYIPLSRDLPKTVTPLMGANTVLDSNCSEFPNSSILDRRYAEIPKELEEAIKLMNERDCKVTFLEKVGYIIHMNEEKISWTWKVITFVISCAGLINYIMTFFRERKNERTN